MLAIQFNFNSTLCLLREYGINVYLFALGFATSEQLLHHKYFHTTFLLWTHRCKWCTSSVSVKLHIKRQ